MDPVQLTWMEGQEIATHPWLSPGTVPAVLGWPVGTGSWAEGGGSPGTPREAVVLPHPGPWGPRHAGVQVVDMNPQA